MLRLDPTQLRLDARDLTWHIDRHNERQALRAAGPPTNQSNKTKIPRKYQQEARTYISPPYSFSQPPATKQKDVGHKHEDSILSNGPVPHGSRSFWDRVLADAGTPTRTQTISQGNPTVIEPSDDLLGISRSSRASIEEHSHWQDENDEETSNSDDPPPPFHDTELFTSSQWPVSTPSASLDSTRVDPSFDMDRAEEEQNLLLEKGSKTAPAKRRLSFNSFNLFRRRVTPDLDGSTEANLCRSSTRKTANGRHESRSIHNRSRSVSANSSSEGDLHDGMYGSRRDRRTISASLEAYGNGKRDVEASGSKHVSNDVASRSKLPAGPSSTPHGLILRHASGLPRSSLYISQAATSSSPHKEPAMTEERPDMSASAGLLGLPPRRRKRYKPRSESYPFVSSEDLDMSALPQLDGPSTFQSNSADLPSLTVSYPSTHDMAQVPTPPLGDPWDYHAMSASPAGTPNHEGYTTGGSYSPFQVSNEWSSPHESYQDPVEISSYQSLSSMGSHHTRAASSHSQMGSLNPTPSRRNLSPLAEPFLPASARRNPSTQLSLPPPFSATPRNSSFNSVLPSSSSVSPHTPPPRLSSYSVSPAPHSHAHIPIYNDNLSPTTQPQTPAELPRNRRQPPFASQHLFHTVPAHPQSFLTTRDARLANWQAFRTPTRAPSTRTRTYRDFEQENIGAMDAEERRWRRELARGLRMGREEMERDR